VAETAVPTSDMKRPNPLQWLRYSLGAGLPPALRDWVLHDTTCGTWVLRQVLRSLLVVMPLILVLLLVVPGPLWIRAMAALGGTLMGLFYSLGYMVETTEHRLVKAGFAAGTGQLVRDRRSMDQRSAATARRREKMFARMDRRN
jgi:Family of unknown function (DUF5313)